MRLIASSAIFAPSGPPKILLVQRTVSLPSLFAPAIAASSSEFFGGVCACAMPAPTKAATAMVQRAIVFFMSLLAQQFCRFLVVLIDAGMSAPAGDRHV